MLRYVKVCPRCGFENDELTEVCERDGEFLGMVPAIPATGASPSPAPAALKTQPQPAAPPQNVEVVRSADAATQHDVTMRLVEPTLRLYLETTTGQCYEIRHGYVLGQAHPTSNAQIQLSGIPGLNYVHRRHCSFEFKEGHWYIRAIQQNNYTNPTAVNQERLLPDQSVALNNGDRLTLSNVALNIRIIEMP